MRRGTCSLVSKSRGRSRSETVEYRRRFNVETACVHWLAGDWVQQPGNHNRAVPPTSGVSSLMGQVGAISALKGLSYWSRTRQQWQTLILQAYALRDADSGQPRADFSPDEFKQGKLLYFAEEDNVQAKRHIECRF